jgi:hypothetical protein
MESAAVAGVVSSDYLVWVDRIETRHRPCAIALLWARPGAM